MVRQRLSVEDLKVGQVYRSIDCSLNTILIRRIGSSYLPGNHFRPGSCRVGVECVIRRVKSSTQVRRVNAESFLNMIGGLVEAPSDHD
jgi:hypothetical protein